jgi:hypothetical protein
MLKASATHINTVIATGVRNLVGVMRRVYRAVRPDIDPA